MSIDPDRRTLRLNRTLKNRHLAESHSTGNWNYTLAAEVGLLTRNIVIEGADDENQVQEKQSFGCRVLIGSFGGSSALNRRVLVENVEFRRCGQEGWSDENDPRYGNELNLVRLPILQSDVLIPLPLTNVHSYRTRPCKNLKTSTFELLNQHLTVHFVAPDFSLTISSCREKSGAVISYQA